MPARAGSLPNDTLTAVTGIRLGHATDAAGASGCTVVLAPSAGCVASGVALGGAPGTRELALLAPEKSLERINAVVLAGGSALGLAAATGVVDWLLERGVGFATPHGPVPIVPAAVLYDRGVGRPDAYPDAAMGYAAAAAASAAPVAMGRVGAGAGASVGKYRGFARSSPSGIGSAARRVAGAVVAAVAVSNAIGDIIDPDTGRVLAGAEGGGDWLTDFSSPLSAPGANTTLVVAATDAPISKAQAHQLAQSAHVGIARVTRPSHTPHDGDTCFVLSTGRGPAVSVVTLSVAVQEVVAAAILAGVRAAKRG